MREMDEKSGDSGISTARFVRTRRRKIGFSLLLAVLVGLSVAFGTMMTTTFSCTIAQGDQGPDVISSPTISEITMAEIVVETNEDCIAVVPLKMAYIGFVILLVSSIVVWENSGLKKT